MLKRFIILAIGSLVLAAASNAQDAAQDDIEQSQADNTTQVEQAQRAAQDAQTSSRVRSTNRRTLYFVGPRARAQRQLGPGIGAPKSILPTPFVSRGSLAVPAAENTDTLPADAATIVPGQGTPADNVEGLESVDASALSSEQQQQVVEPEQEDTPDDPFGELFQEGILERLDPSGIPVNTGIGAGGIETVWQGYSRAEIIAFLERIEKPTFSPALSRLASAVAASRLTLPEPERDSDIIEMLTARLAVFEAFADVSAYTALIDALPIDRDWSALARHQAHAHLLKGELPDACVVAESQRAIDINAYWVRLSAFCMAAVGDRTGVDFQLGILEETRSLDTTFYQLLDQILIEAEQPTGAVIPQPTVLSAPMPADIVSAAMARLARVEINDVDLSDANLLAVPMLLQNPSLSPEAKVKLLDAMLSRGVADAALMSAAAGNFPIDSGLLTNLLAGPVDEDASIDNIDDTSDQVVTELESGLQDDRSGEEASETLKQLTLLAAIAQQTDMAPQALEQVWESNVANGTLAKFASSIEILTRALQNENDTAAVAAIAVRAAAMTGGDAFAKRILSLRTQAAGTDEAKDVALVRLWPLIAIADVPNELSTSSRVYDATAFERWWQTMSDNENKFVIANSLLTAMDGLGFDVPDRAWALVADGPAVFEGSSISPSLWRALDQSVAAQDPVATLTAFYKLYGEVNAKDIPPSVVGVLINSLRRVGFDAIAKAIVFDILISQGL
ncbi:hypothetical protein [Kordiimonas aquimaris]|uniref:hypothetical protein n=1 Tax=Kordiimonas aquimaris TaxID=707591 RepID=UPI0021D3999C|nr:hypothetical protein [Kordiimonas aquimaris]